MLELLAHCNIFCNSFILKIAVLNADGLHNFVGNKSQEIALKYTCF